MSKMNDMINNLHVALNLTEEQTEVLVNYIDYVIEAAVSDLDDRINHTGMYDPDY